MRISKEIIISYLEEFFFGRGGRSHVFMRNRGSKSVKGDCGELRVGSGERERNHENIAEPYEDIR